MYAVELENISKTFPGGVQANKNITLRINEGEVHGLLGENGAGKSTLMNILYGLISKDSGKIVIKEEEVELDSPQDAIIRGVGMVHQHFKLIPPLTVTENVILGLEPIRNKLDEKVGIPGRLIKTSLPIDFKGAAYRIREIAEENGFNIDPEAKIMDLSVGLQQRVEIIKTLYREADILILDEPTAVLTPQEVDDLFITLEKFRERGKTIILITHKLREPMALCDRISVLRDGELVGTVNKDDTSPKELAKMMVGRPVVFRVEKTPATPGDVVLSVKDVHIKDIRGLNAVNGVTFDVRSGEILGIAGVEGNGQTELVDAITGLRKIESGHIFISGKEVSKYNPREVRNVGLAHIPADRHGRGIILGFTIEENLTLGRHHSEPFATGPMSTLLNFQEIKKLAENLVMDYNIKVRETKSLGNTLSGGNQQKVVVARELAGGPQLLVAAQPTRGLDVGATEYIHNVLIKMRDTGVAILLVSAELDEIRSLSDRIAVIFDGEIVAFKDPNTVTAEELGLLMAGHSEGSTPKENIPGEIA
jgi:simple sugar transport system ATP-binding protein